MDEKLNYMLLDAGIYHCDDCSQPMTYKGSGRYVCENCKKEVLSDFGKIKVYLEENGPSNAIDISEATGVPRREIMGFLREGRVEVAPGSESVLFCAGCGVAIRFGTYCAECEKRRGSSHQGQGTFVSQNKAEKGKMRFEID